MRLKDVLRMVYLSAQNHRMMRFWNEQVNAEMENVLEALYAGLTDANRAPQKAR
jgi:very-short-patch-repair endonuclease